MEKDRDASKSGTKGEETEESDDGIVVELLAHNAKWTECGLSVD